MISKLEGHKIEAILSYRRSVRPAAAGIVCTGLTADYSLLPDGKIQVINRCCKDSLDGPVKESKGKAEVVDTATNAKLKVWFFWPFKGSYWIVDLDPGYRWAVVGEPSRKYLWILSRKPFLDEATYQEITERLPLKSYDPLSSAGQLKLIISD